MFGQSGLNPVDTLVDANPLRRPNSSLCYVNTRWKVSRSFEFDKEFDLFLITFLQKQNKQLPVHANCDLLLIEPIKTASEV